MSKVSSLSLFLVVYVLLLYCETADLSAARADKHLAHPHVIRTIEMWRLIEALSIVTIVIGIGVTLQHENVECLPYYNLDSCLWFFQRRDIVGSEVSLVDWKDLFVGACVVFFFARSARHNSSPQTELYPTWYSSYIQATALDAVECSITDDQVDFVKEALLRGRTLDFGCGDGRRLEQLLTYGFGISASQQKQLALCGVDTNATWAGKFVFDECNFAVSLSGEKEKYSVIHLAHVLYEPSTTRAAIDAIRDHAKDDAVICVRGASANSPTYLLSAALATRLLGYHPHHHWRELYLTQLVRACKLMPINENTLGESEWQRKPDMVFKQSMGIEGENKLSPVLGAIFSEQARAFSDEIIAALRAARVKEVSVDDNVYFFKYRPTANAGGA